MMGAHCYVIFSKKLNRFYTGACQGDLANRIQKHNDHTYGNHRYTAVANDWVLYLDIPVKDYSHAIRLERKIKSMKSAAYIRNLYEHSDMLHQLIEKTGA